MATDDLTDTIDLSLWARIDGHYMFIKLSGRSVGRIFKRFEASYALCHPESTIEPAVVRQIIVENASETFSEPGMWYWYKLPAPLELEVSGQTYKKRRSAIVEQLNSKPSIPRLRERLAAATAQKKGKSRTLELKGILEHIQGDNANRSKSPRYDGVDSEYDSSECDDDEHGSESSNHGEANNGNTQDPEELLKKDARFQLYGDEFEEKIRRGIDNLKAKEPEELNSVYARILKHRQGEDECLDAVFDQLAAKSTTNNKRTHWTFRTSCGVARTLARKIGRPYLRKGKQKKSVRQELIRKEKLPRIIYFIIDALVKEKGVDALLIYTALQDFGSFFVENPQNEFCVPLRDLRLACQSESNDSSAQHSEAASAASTTRSNSEHPSPALYEAIAVRHLPECNRETDAMVLNEGSVFSQSRPSIDGGYASSTGDQRLHGTTLSLASPSGTFSLETERRGELFRAAAGQNRLQIGNNAGSEWHRPNAETTANSDTRRASNTDPASSYTFTADPLQAEPTWAGVFYQARPNLTPSMADETSIDHPQTEPLEDDPDQVPFSCPRFDPVRDAASTCQSEGAASGRRTTASPLSQQSHADLQLSPVAFDQFAVESPNTQTLSVV
ncbi:hypothetical protein MY10362_007948 [Beauveria mimosiformis]